MTLRLGALIVLLMLLAGAAGAGPLPAPAATGSERWQGRFCTRPGCTLPDRSPSATLVGFASGIAGVAWWSRRRIPRRPQ